MASPEQVVEADVFHVEGVVDAPVAWVRLVASPLGDAPSPAAASSIVAYPPASAPAATAANIADPSAGVCGEAATRHGRPVTSA